METENLESVGTLTVCQGIINKTPKKERNENLRAVALKASVDVYVISKGYSDILSKADEFYDYLKKGKKCKSLQKNNGKKLSQINDTDVS